MKRNGLPAALRMVRERLTMHYDESYTYEAPAAVVLAEQRLAQKDFAYRPLISILVPVYETPKPYMEALLDCMKAQTYDNWELILADAGRTDQVQRTVEDFLAGEAGKDIRYLPDPAAEMPQGEHSPVSAEEESSKTEGKRTIVYRKLSANEGISGNSNQALDFVSGEYIGLLDHDDLLTPDALYEVVRALNTLSGDSADTMGAGTCIRPLMIYSDEDKCDETGGNYNDPNIKTEFNKDILMSNNYICHFLVLESRRLKKLRFRPEFDGAQDYDLVLRFSTGISADRILHVPKVLYHWRCHSASTAANPASKMYAYEAGKRALEDYLAENRIPGHAEHTEHLGFYRVEYEHDLLTDRPEVGGWGGPVLDRNGRICSGVFTERGGCLFRGLPADFSGPGNKACLRRGCEAMDARTLVLREELKELYAEHIGLEYIPFEERSTAWCNALDEQIWRQRSTALCRAIRERGFLIVYDPGRSLSR